MCFIIGHHETHFILKGIEGFAILPLVYPQLSTHQTQNKKSTSSSWENSKVLPQMRLTVKEEELLIRAPVLRLRGNLEA